MSEVIQMAKPKEIHYFKPYMGALSGWIGKSIIETIRNTPKPDRTELNKKADECMAQILAEKLNGK
ncbi:hypothetical protein [Butyrivibrio hungatei]|uniref:Uncharacterized protein n=1 Tax=Butyrivibrio hungatei TaxID=185008 RepID=A0A1D9P5U5_9FIRM|nr:hypothetical protein [Butyrivibrio hungatei]AOZ97909.1 hypothetical protein bhn_II110 [Butyrivibrio hungatei]